MEEIDGISRSAGTYTVVLPFKVDATKTFCTRAEVLSWINEGLDACEGSEREHYVRMLEQLRAGEHTLYYSEKSYFGKQYELYEELKEKCGELDCMKNEIARISDVLRQIAVQVQHLCESFEEARSEV